MRCTTLLLAVSVIAPLFAAPVPILELRAPQAAARSDSLPPDAALSSQAATFAASATGTGYITGALAATQTGGGDETSPTLTTTLAAPASVASDASDVDGDDDSTTFPDDPQLDILIGQLLDDPVVSQLINQLLADALIGEIDDPTDRPDAPGDASDTGIASSAASTDASADGDAEENALLPVAIPVSPVGVTHTVGAVPAPILVGAAPAPVFKLIAQPVGAPASPAAASVTGDRQLDITLGNLLNYKPTREFLKGLIGDARLAQTATVGRARPARPTGVVASSPVPVVPLPVKAAMRRVYRRPVPRV